jgi:hypothetical protein
MPAIAKRLPAKYLIKIEAPKTISSPQQHEAYISRLLELQRKAHRTAEETETAKLLIVLIADYEGKHFTIEKASGVVLCRLPLPRARSYGSPTRRRNTNAALPTFCSFSDDRGPCDLCVIRTAPTTRGN